MNYKITSRLFLFLSVLLAFLSSCDQDELTVLPVGKYEDGTIVMNGGVFGQQSGDFTYYHNKDSIKKNIFQLQNDFVPGGFIQSITTYNNLILTAVNVSGNIDGKIQVIDRNSFESVKTIEGDQIFAPRFIRTKGSKAYFTDLGKDAYGSNPGTASVSILDLNSYQVEKRIEVPRLPADLAIVDNMAYAAIDGYYDGTAKVSVSDSTIQIIDLDKGEITGQIIVKKNPYGIAVDKDNMLWILCTEGFIVKVNPATKAIDATIAAPGIGFDVKHTFNDDSTKLYFIASSWKPGATADDPWVNVSAINSLDINTAEITTTAIPANAASGIGYKDDKVYVGESTNGTVSIYQLDGTKLETFSSGDFPGQFLFNN